MRSGKLWPLLWMLALGGAAQAVEFDEQLKVPRAVSATDLRTKIETLSAKVSGPGAVTALEALRDRALARERFDTQWMLGQMVDARVPLTELTSLGFSVKEDGSLSIDTRAHPEWRPLESNLQLLTAARLVEGLERELTMRGLPAADYLKLREYVSGHDLARARAESKLSIMLSASRKAKKLEKLRRLDDRFFASLSYQRARAVAEVERQWALGLLDALSLQGQRVIASFVSEGASNTSFTPESTSEAYRHERELLLRPDFEKLAKEAFAEGKL